MGAYTDRRFRWPEADGTEEVIRTSLASGTGVTAMVPDGATIKVVDNSKSFSDTEDHWATKAIAFVSGHELLSGTGGDSFSPDSAMTRAMVMTVLARYEGVDTSGGAEWHEKGVEWAIAKNISSGADVESPITRQELATMLWRYVDNPAASADLTAFSDGAKVPDWASPAMQWAVSAGIIQGSDNSLNPGGTATRAEVAAMLMRFCEKTGR